MNSSSDKLKSEPHQKLPVQTALTTFGEADQKLLVQTALATFGEADQKLSEQTALFSLSELEFTGFYGFSAGRFDFSARSCFSEPGT